MTEKKSSDYKGGGGISQKNDRKLSWAKTENGEEDRENSRRRELCEMRSKVT